MPYKKQKLTTDNQINIKNPFSTVPISGKKTEIRKINPVHLSGSFYR